MTINSKNNKLAELVNSQYSTIAAMTAVAVTLTALHMAEPFLPAIGQALIGALAGTGLILMAVRHKPTLISDADEPYLWRYRENFDNGEMMDLLFLHEPDSSFITDEPGELTVVTWDDVTPDIWLYREDMGDEQLEMLFAFEPEGEWAEDDHGELTIINIETNEDDR